MAAPGRVTLFHARAVIPDVGGPAPSADTVAVGAGTVLAVGLLPDLRERYPGARLHDLPSGWVVPGLADAHCHPTLAADEACHVTLPVEDQRRAEAVERAIARAAPVNGWIRLVGWLADGTDAGPLDVHLLDRWSPERPLLIQHANGHWGWLNTAGLRLLGLVDDTGRLDRSAVPPGGSADVDRGGRATGRVHEQLLFDVMDPALARNPRLVALASAADRAAALAGIERQYLSRGVTAVTDALCGEAGWELLADRTEGLRYAAIAPVHAASAPWLQAARSGPVPLLGLKTFVDGALNGGTCLLTDPVPGTVPQQVRDVDDIATELYAARDAGVPLAVHANGDAAVDVVLEAGERTGLAGRIEHASVLRDDQIARIREQGWSVVPFGSYIAEHGDRLSVVYGIERVARMVRHRSLLAAGVPVAGCSDHPCAGLDPWRGVWSCVTRSTGTQVIGPEERLTPAEAVGLYTRGAARLRSSSATAGTLAPGEPADLVVLGADPRTAEGVQQVMVEGAAVTVVAGEVVYDRSAAAGG